jgi:hypothetical protein
MRLRIFFWLIAAIAAYWVLAVVWFIVFPPAAVTAALAKLPAAIRGTIEYRAWSISFISTAIRAVIFLGLAWLAAFRRKNWARWGVALLFVVMQVVPLILAVRFGRVGPFVESEYLNWQSDLVFALFVVAIFLSFTGDAREAFAPAGERA